MNHKTLPVLAFTAALGFSGAAGAGLTSYTSNGAALVFDNDYGPNGLTWTADANLFKTQYDADNTVVDQIIAEVPTITHMGTVIFPSPYLITAADFNIGTGSMSWFGAMAWVEWLGTIKYGGANDWRLWSASNENGTGPDSGPVGGSELGHLFYTESGLSQGNDINSSAVLKQHFTNMQSSVYWSGTEDAPGPLNAWVFDATYGGQVTSYKGSVRYYAWAVRPGDVAAAISEPASVALVGLGLAALGWARRRG